MVDGRRSDNQQSHLSFVSIFVLSFSDLFTDRASLCGDLCVNTAGMWGKNLNPPGRVCRAVCINT